MYIKIYQIAHNEENRDKIFAHYDEIEEVDMSIYDEVWEGNVPCEDLEDVFRMFNIDIPSDFVGHSLSVSDVVEVCDSNPTTAIGKHYCDWIGFVQFE